MDNIAFDLISCIIIGAFVIVVMVQDIKEYKIKNISVIVMIAAGMLLRTVFGGAEGALGGFLGMLIPLALFPLFALRMLGAGDIKALCAVGAAVGAYQSLWFTVFSIISGGFIALLFMISRKNASERLGGLIKYIKFSIMSRSLKEYPAGGERSVFRFSFGIAGGYCIYVIMTIVKYLGG